MRLFIPEKNHIVMFVCALKLFKLGCRYSNEVMNRKTPSWSQYQNLKRHEIIHSGEKPYCNVYLSSKTIQVGLQIF
jgi:hypothetical protein